MRLTICSRSCSVRAYAWANAWANATISVGREWFNSKNLKSEKPRPERRYLLRSDYQRKRMKVLKYFNLASPLFATQVNELYPEDQIGLVIPWT